MSATSAQVRSWVRVLCVVGLACVLVPWAFELFGMIVIWDEVRPLLWIAILKGFGVLYAALFLEIFVHEGGHWFFGRLVGIRISDFVVGTVRGSVKFTGRGIRFSFGPWLRWGYVREIPTRPGQAFGKQCIFLAGGMAATLLVVGALYLVPVPRGAANPWVEAFESLRWYMFLLSVGGLWGSAWPRHVLVEGRLTPNDGLRIQQAWQGRGKEEGRWREWEQMREIGVLTREKKYREAAAMLERALETNPERDEWRSTLVVVHTLAEDWEAAFRTHHEIIERTEANSDARALAVDSAATLALQLGRRDELVWLRPLVEHAKNTHDSPTLVGTLGSVLVELDETEAGVKLLDECVDRTDAPHDRAIANAYLAKAALRSGDAQRARKLLGRARATGVEHGLVRRVVEEIEPQLGEKNGGNQ